MNSQGFIAATLLCIRVFGIEEWNPLFNGQNLSGWVPVNVAPTTFTVRDGVIVSTGKPTGVIRTERQYENFELELDWKHIEKGGNAGLFVWSYPITAPGVPFTRSLEVQILDGQNGETYTSHGDVFAIHGAHFTPDRPHPKGWERSLPSEWRAKPAGEWNHYHVVCTNGTISLAVNGKVVSGGSKAVPRKGYICLEAEGTECHFKNIRIKELPGGSATAEQTAPLADGFVSIYNGLNLDGWRASEEHRKHWRSEDWILDYDGKCDAADPHLWTQKSYRDFVLICDWRWQGKGTKAQAPKVLPDGSESGKEEVVDAGDSGIYLRGNDKSQVNIWCWSVGSGEVYGYRTDPNMPPEVKAGVTPKVRADKPIGEWNRFVITMKGDRVSVELNGKQVVLDAQLPGIPREGPIALQHHGAPIQFGNIYIKELK